ncbi:MAG TPA: hypothetical protein HA257_04955 [Candidatus Methanoperedenaceae archaeon]|nr:hypothetical protein [Candidatus Methanoperedenaceae archaeon]
MKLRYIALVLVVLVALSGCTGKNGKTPSEGTPVPPATSAAGIVTDAELTSTEDTMAGLDSLLADMSAADDISVDEVGTVI